MNAIEPCSICGARVREIPVPGATATDPKQRKCTDWKCITNSPERSLTEAP